MPHLTLEFSDNILEKENLSVLFQQCHELLAQTLPTQISGCKSRALEYKNFYIGDGGTMNAFVHADLKVLPGRPEDLLINAGENIMEILKSHFTESRSKLQLQITLEISALEKTYFKFAG
ncbi:5-carboxymethyl-2-hydroxymuconate Delta-isomerase [Aquicella siphonis]|uniref:5-carboxymethyl-2-hydroxymuconate Delta-isomerase n=1 Tax=Aquicella siphonis TaxID=254247 RepID=A0A5E4PIX7_9COXI|nr:5-carboxymethyl-2-hydroxymuconate Delta-isomerase [Aquicella siphonis]VVC76387.1 5-carboxymethyl-2-hydroxymuconate Delta-isomerase [Aquicella siphonis]